MITEPRPLANSNNDPIAKRREPPEPIGQCGYGTRAPSPLMHGEGCGYSSPEVRIEDVSRRLQAQRREGQRRVGGRACGERAAADQIKVLVVVRALELVHHRLLGIVPHPTGSHYVAGTGVVQRNTLTVDFLLE